MTKDNQEYLEEFIRGIDLCFKLCFDERRKISQMICDGKPEANEMEANWPKKHTYTITKFIEELGIYVEANIDPRDRLKFLSDIETEIIDRLADRRNTWMFKICRIGIWNLKSKARGQAANALPEPPKEPETSQPEPIIWKGTGTQLHYVFELLANMKFLDSDQADKIASLLSKHFVYEDGEPIKAKSLRDSKHNNSLGKRCKNSQEIKETLSKAKERK